MSTTERQRYIVYVLWLRGHTEGFCGRIVGLRPKQVAGLITRSPYRNRSAMTDEERQGFLNELKPLSSAYGLKDNVFEILSLDGKQKK